MSYFKEAPVVVLETMEEVREVIAKPKKECCGQKGGDIYRIKSVWLVSVIDEIVASGRYPYNADVKKLAESKLGFPPKTDAEYSREGDTLSLLIYNAQCYRHSDEFRAKGYEPFTDELLASAFRDGKKVEVLSEGLLGSTFRRLNPKEINGRIYAMVPKCSKRYVAPVGQPAKIA